MTIRVKDGRTLTQACRDNGLTFFAVYDKIRYRGMSPDKAIQYCKNLKPRYMCHGKTLRQYCKDVNVPYNSVVKYINEGGKESFEEIVDNKLYKKNCYSDTQFCKDMNINYRNAKCRYYYNIIHKDCNKTFREFCKDCYNL